MPRGGRGGGGVMPPFKVWAPVAPTPPLPSHPCAPSWDAPRCPPSCSLVSDMSSWPPLSSPVLPRPVRWS